MTTALLLIISIAIFIILSVVAYFYLERTKEKRLESIRKSKKLSNEDETYNEVKKTKRTAQLMQRRGQNMEDTKKEIIKAERALKEGNTSKAKEITEEVKNKFPDKKTGASKKSNNSTEKDTKKAYTIDELDEIEAEESEEAKRRREKMEKEKEKLDSLPDNYLESKFEMDIAREALQKEKNEEAEEYFKRAEKSFENENYTDALKYSVKCNKIIKGKEAGLIGGQDIDKKEGPPEKVKEHFPEMVGGETSQQVESNKKRGKKTEKDDKEKTDKIMICPDCGFEGREGESFCPDCGVELTSLNKCPECGHENEEEDKFCRKCGHELEEIEITCPDCGTKVSEEDRFCPGCGVKFE